MNNENVMLYTQQIKEYLEQHLRFSGNVITSHCPLNDLKKEIGENISYGIDNILIDCLKDCLGEEFIMKNDGETYYYKDGFLHRDGDKPAIVSIGYEGTFLAWYQYDLLHRENDKPATIDSGYEDIYQWYEHGTVHRAGNRPAVIYKCAGETSGLQWFSHGIKIEKENLPKND